MAVLLVVPNDELRHALRDRLDGRGGSLRATTYSLGLVLAEQHWIDTAVLWSKPGANAEAVDAVKRLRQCNRDVRIIVITPRFTDAGTAAFMQHLQVDAYRLDWAVDAIIEEVLGVPTITERAPQPVIRASQTSTVRSQ